VTPPFISPTEQHARIVALFLEAFERPCGCPLELREERDGLRCATCDRRFVAREAKR
jgi:hypothetical protein